MQNLLSPSSKDRGLPWGSIVAVTVLIAALLWGAKQPWFPVKLSFQIPELFKSAPEKEKKQEAGDSLSGYSAVYLDNGQEFYGKVEGKDGGYLVMTDAFYYQPWVRSLVPGNMRILKLGLEIHQPEDRVYISPSHVVMQERLKNDSKVVKAILKYKAE